MINFIIGISISFFFFLIGITAVVKVRSEESVIERNRLLGLIEASNGLYFEYDQQHDNIIWYGGAKDVFPVSSGDVTPVQLAHPDDIEKMEAQYTNLLRGGCPYYIYVRLLDNLNKYRYCQYRLLAIRNAAGVIVRTMGMIYDMDEQIRKEKSMTEHRHIYQEATELAAGNYYKIGHVDLKTGISRYVKLDERELLGMKQYTGEDYHMAEITYDDLLDYITTNYIHPDDAKKYRYLFSLENMRYQFQHGQTELRMIYRRKKDADADLPYRLTQARYIACGEEEKWESVMLYIEDIHDREAKQEKYRIQLEQAMAVKDECLEYLTDDVPTSLNQMMVFQKLGLQAVEKGDESKSAAFIAKANEAAKELMVMLSDISVYHKIQSESMQFQERSFSINQLSDMCYDYANYLIAGKMISYMWVGELDGVYKGDQKRLSQVAFNLIENAVKHNRMGGSIRIEAEQKAFDDKNDQFTLVIKDTGIGMTKEEQENLFQPFIREESGNHLKRFSNSLGLFVSKHVIDEIGGKIDVESARNQGTKVTVQFCLQRANAS